MKIWLGSNLNPFADNLAHGQIKRFVCAEKKKQAISPLPFSKNVLKVLYSKFNFCFFRNHYIANLPYLCVASTGPLMCDVKAEVGSKWTSSTIVNLAILIMKKSTILTR